MTTKYIYKNINGHVIREHRIVWEKHNNAKLLPWASIHHLNGKKCDNRIENLQVMSKGKHNSIHQHRLGTSTKSNEIIQCACGCGKETTKYKIESNGYFGSRTRARRFIHGHYNRGRHWKNKKLEVVEVT